MRGRVRVLDLFCGIGGLAAALEGFADAAVVGAIDVNRQALAVYGANFPHPIQPRTIESLPLEAFAAADADLWWLSPPCQPHTQKGARRDVDDARSAALHNVVQAIGALKPRYLALENVFGFVGSRAHRELRQTLDRHGYLVHERQLCPSALGVPNRRPRFYLTASRDGLVATLGRSSCETLGDGAPAFEGRSGSPLVARPCSAHASLAARLEREPDEALIVDPALVARYRGALDLVDPHRADAIAACFTSGYGRAVVRCGSYLTDGAQVRRFSPREIASLLGFAPSYRFPPTIERRTAWRLLGDSLSVPAVREALRAFPPFASL
ncbi:MAG: DNA cytosine methyltransferase [Myxococcales bacterium]|nr:DNA cytosine methyltransferase [Myxococcales bacterium]